MNPLDNPRLWERYRKHLCHCPDIGLSLDISRMLFEDDFIERMADPLRAAFEAMDRLEKGHKANADEDRMVGHYWLRDPQRAPEQGLKEEITRNLLNIKRFAESVHQADVAPQEGEGFYIVLVIGIGGSALGPQFIADALGSINDPMIVRFIDNTDPDGIDRALAEIDDSLGQTLTIVVSKSGGTKETHNGLLEVAGAYRKAGIDFARHAVAVTMEGSSLYKKATSERWLHIFPMWDWVGGRTSQLSSVGLVPAALQGVDVDELIEGARLCDEITRKHDVAENPAALLALMWFDAVRNRGKRNMVVLPYRDRLQLFSRYLQQLIMESIGKRHDRAGKEVHEGLTVLGNKGTTDQHALVQQLQEGTNDFFVNFIGVRRDREGSSFMVEEQATTGDFLHAFLLGTRQALYEGGRESITIMLEEMNARSAGALIALFERAVGLYAELININAYHQPGVEMGKKAASGNIALQARLFEHLRRQGDAKFTAEELAQAVGKPDLVETVLHLLDHAAANPDHGVTRDPGEGPFGAKYGVR